MADDQNQGNPFDDEDEDENDNDDDDDDSVNKTSLNPFDDTPDLKLNTDKKEKRIKRKVSFSNKIKTNYYETPSKEEHTNNNGLENSKNKENNDNDDNIVTNNVSKRYISKRKKNKSRFSIPSFKKSSKHAENDDDNGKNMDINMERDQKLLSPRQPHNTYKLSKSRTRSSSLANFVRPKKREKKEDSSSNSNTSNSNGKHKKKKSKTKKERKRRNNIKNNNSDELSDNTDSGSTTSSQSSVILATGTVSDSAIPTKTDSSIIGHWKRSDDSDIKLPPSILKTRKTTLIEQNRLRRTTSGPLVSPYIKKLPPSAFNYTSSTLPQSKHNNNIASISDLLHKPSSTNVGEGESVNTGNTNIPPLNAKAMNDAVNIAENAATKVTNAMVQMKYATDKYNRAKTGENLFPGSSSVEVVKNTKHGEEEGEWISKPTKDELKTMKINDNVQETMNRTNLMLNNVNNVNNSTSIVTGKSTNTMVIIASKLSHLPKTSSLSPILNVPLSDNASVINDIVATINNDKAVINEILTNDETSDEDDSNLNISLTTTSSSSSAVSILKEDKSNEYLEKREHGNDSLSSCDEDELDDDDDKFIVSPINTTINDKNRIINDRVNHYGELDQERFSGMIKTLMFILEKQTEVDRKLDILTKGVVKNNTTKEIEKQMRKMTKKVDCMTSKQRDYYKDEKHRRRKSVDQQRQLQHIQLTNVENCIKHHYNGPILSTFESILEIVIKVDENLQETNSNFQNHHKSEVQALKQALQEQTRAYEKVLESHKDQIITLKRENKMTMKKYRKNQEDHQTIINQLQQQSSLKERQLCQERKKQQAQFLNIRKFMAVLKKGQKTMNSSDDSLLNSSCFSMFNSYPSSLPPITSGTGDRNNVEQ